MSSIAQRRRSQRGLALLDVMLGMTIFALIAVIALQSFGHLKDRTRMMAALADAESIGKLITGSDEFISNAPASSAAPFARLGGGAGGGRMATSVGAVALPTTLRAIVASEAEKRSFDKIIDPVVWFAVRLTGENELKEWKTSSTDFGFCIQHANSGSWAAYRSDLGGVYDTGWTGGCPVVDFPGASTPEDADEDDGDGSSLPTPTPTPTESPSAPVTTEPTTSPTTEPTVTPTESPTSPATTAPTESPTSPATTEPTTTPSPTVTPTSTPTTTPTVTPTPTPTPPPVLWTPPTNATDIEALCKKNWGSLAIHGSFAIVYGTPGNDIIFTGNGGQTIYGYGGNDLICGGNGKDTLYGGAGNDVLYGGNGKDLLYGGSGRDFLHGNNGKDSMYVGDGFEDVAYGGNGSDVYLEDGPADAEDTFVQAGPNSP